MRQTIILASLCLASLFTLSATSAEKLAAITGNSTPDDKSDSVRVVPLSTGYESAIKGHTVKPIFRPAETAPALYGPGDIYSLLVTGKESNNIFFQFEAIVPEGGGPPPHVHSREDETFYIVSGTLDVLVGDTTYHAKRGDFVYIPRGAIHGFKNAGGGVAVQLVTFSPSGMEDFFQEIFPVVKDRKAAPPPITEELIQKMDEAASKYGLKYAYPDIAKH